MNNNIITLALTFFMCASAYGVGLPSTTSPDNNSDESYQRATKFTAFAGYATGGEKLIDVEYENGRSGDIKAGQGIFLGVGIRHPFSTELQYPLFIEASVGYFNDNETGSNIEVNFTRYPIDLLVSTRINRIRLAGGVTHHLSPTFEISGDFGNGKQTYDDATGAAFEASYAINKVAEIALRYTEIEYGVSNIEFDGSSFGVGIIARF